MRIAIVILILISSLHSSGYASILIEIPLPDLVGDYPGSIRECEFELAVAPAVVYNVWIRYSGIVNAGEYYCSDTGPLEGPFPIGLVLSATMPDTVSGDQWKASEVTIAESGAFEMTVKFVDLPPIYNPTWQFLLDGGGTVSCSGYTPMLIPECFIDTDPSATVEEATLIIECDFPIAVEFFTWGCIKSLYR